MDRTRSLADLHRDFRAGSTTSIPIAGMVCWGLPGVASTMLTARLVGTLALYIIVGLLPLAVLLDRLKGRNLFATNAHPLDQLVLSPVGGVGVVVPLVLVAAKAANQPDLLVLGMAILAGVIWIPYGWAAEDRAGRWGSADGRTRASEATRVNSPQWFPSSCLDRPLPSIAFLASRSARE